MRAGHARGNGVSRRVCAVSRVSGGRSQAAMRNV